MKLLYQKKIWGILILLSVLFYSNNIADYPRGRHASGMSNYYAVSLGFLDNDFDFFHPTTYCLNPQYAPTQKKANGFWMYSLEDPKGITAIDFPLHQFNIALLMKFFNSTNPSIYRIYMLILSLIGLFFLYKTVFTATNSFYFAIFIVFFTFTSPTFSFFANGFLVTSASLSFLFIASFYFLLSYKTKKYYFFFVALFLITISALTRFPFIIYIIGLVIIFLYQSLFKKKSINLFFSCLSALLIVLSYFFYNKFYLSYNFGTLFLSSSNPAKSLIHFFESIGRIILYRSWLYGTLIHYVAIGFIIFLIYKNKKTLNLTFIGKYLILITLGVLCYFILMIHQFAFHDYYILDTFFPLLLFWIIYAFSFFQKEKLNSFKKQIFIFCFLGFFLNLITVKFDSYIRKDRVTEITYKNFKNSYKILDSIEIQKSAKLLILNTSGSNIAQIGLKRKGYSMINNGFHFTNFKNAFMKWDYDYIVIQNFMIKQTVLKQYPKFYDETKLLFKNKNISIYLKK